ncbi:hypothetical protein WOLCODRAFT_165939, partial [Wolfiporia cocos MD-104 SS10]
KCRSSLESTSSRICTTISFSGCRTASSEPRSSSPRLGPPRVLRTSWWNVIRHENGSYVIQHNATGLYASSLYDVFGQAVVAAPTEQFFALRQVGIDQNILNIGTSSGEIYWNEQDTLAGAPVWQYTVVVSGFDNSTESLDTNPHRQWNFTRIADLD